MARKPTITTTVIRGPAAAAEMRQMQRLAGTRQPSSKPVNPAAQHIRDANRTTSSTSKEKAGSGRR
jgi:hypothetical protein